MLRLHGELTPVWLRLKFWLRDLPEPLMPEPFFEDAMAASHQPDQIQALLERIPQINRLVASYLDRLCYMGGPYSRSTGSLPPG